RRAVEEALAPYYPSGQAAGALNQAFMDLGATVCLPHGAPHCATCPLARLCLAHDAGSEQQLPVKSKKAKRRVEQKTVLLLHQGRALALTKRPDQGLLAGLWELPNLPGHLTQEEVEAWLAACGLRPLTIARLPDARHIFSHVEWQMQGWAVELAAPVAMVAEGDDGFVWASPEELADAYSVPSAFQYFLHEHRG
ncbi:NUDIX domain-containing protein, partial [Mitsuokella multacida]